MEAFLYGILEGLSFGDNPTCKGGLVSGVYYAFTALENKEIYNPSKIIKFQIAVQKVVESSNTIYA
jgi:hypothetical protein